MKDCLFKNRERNWIRIIVPLFVFFCLIFSNISGSIIQAATRPKLVKVAFYEMDGFQEVGENRALSGYAYNYLLRLQKYTNWHLDYITVNENGEPLSFNEAQEMVRKNEADLICGLDKHARMSETDFLFPDYYMGSKKGLVITKKTGSRVDVESGQFPEDFKLGLVTGDSCNRDIEKYMAEHVEDVEYLYYRTYEDMTIALQNGSVDAIFSNSLRQSNRDTEYTISTMNVTPIYVATSKGSGIYEELNEAVKSLNIDYPDLSERLFKKYYGNTNEFFLTAEEQTYIKEHPVIRIAMDVDFRPLTSYNQATGEVVGIGCYVLDEVSKKTGLTFEYVLFSDLETLADQQGKEGGVQMISTMAEDTVRADRLGWDTTTAYMEIPISMVCNKDSKKEEKELVYAEPKGFYCEYLIKNHYSYKEVRSMATMEDCLEAVENGEVDRALLPTYSLELMRKERAYNDIIVYSEFGSMYNVCMAIAKQEDPRLHMIIDKALSDIPNANINEMIFNYSANTEESLSMKRLIQKNPFPFAVGVLAVLVLSVITIVYIYKNHVKANQERELSERLQVDLELQRMAYKEAIAANEVYEFYYDVPSGSCFCPDRTTNHFYCEDTVTDFPESFAINHAEEEDVEDFIHLFEEIKNGAPKAVGEFLLDKRFWVRITVTPVRWDKSGVPMHVVGMIEDVTDRKQKENRSNSYYHLLASQYEVLVRYAPERNRVKYLYGSDANMQSMFATVTNWEQFTERISQMLETLVTLDDLSNGIDNNRWFNLIKQPGIMNELKRNHGELSLDLRGKQAGEHYRLIIMTDLKAKQPHTEVLCGLMRV